MKSLGTAAWVAGICVFSLSSVLSPAQQTNRQRLYLEQLQRLLPRSELWEKWQQRSGELPPDFDLMPSIPYLPDALRSTSGQPVQTSAQWGARRQELLQLIRHYITGTVPPPPGNVRPSQVQTRQEKGLTIHNLILEFGPEHRARLSMELIIPPGAGPFPVFMTQDNHRRWALVAVSRGYIGCIYAGADSRDDTGAFAEIWPEFDWTKLTRRAWAASRCLDYLYTLPQVDRSRVLLTGHSRNGKLSLIAGALDERFSAIISSSSGAGGACSYRLFSEAHFGEGIELITRVFPDWLHPRLRFFAGRENKLPVDQHAMIACLAPRPCLIATALNDSVESVWAIEQNYYAAQKVYHLLGAGAALNLLYRPGGHGLRTGDIESYLDWADVKFGRKQMTVGNRPICPTYADWLQASGERIDPRQFPSSSLDGLLSSRGGNPITTPDQWKVKREEIRQRMIWALGEAPAVATSVPGSNGAEKEHMAILLGRPKPDQGLQKRSLNFGNYLAGDLYHIAGVDQANRLPAIVWLHPFSFSNGYVAGYRRGEPIYLTLARLGYAVLAFDLIGHGARLEEGRLFYQRYPRWSLLGKQISDIRTAVDALGMIEFIDKSRIFLVGYGPGAMAGLHAAALDERVAGVVSYAGFTPMRLDTAEKGTGGIARFSQWFPLLPRLGAFVGSESHIPYDYHEVLALIAPRLALVITPALDYQSSLQDVNQCLQEASRVYSFLGAANNLAFLGIEEFNRLSPEVVRMISIRMKQ